MSTTAPSPQFGELTNPSDLLARYLFTSRWYRGTRVLHNAFMPPPDRELSVYWCQGLEPPAVLELGKLALNDRPGPDRLHGHAEFTVGVLPEELKAIRDNDPRDRHTNVVGWPDPETSKDEVVALAKDLAARAKLCLLEAPLAKTSG